MLETPLYEGGFPFLPLRLTGLPAFQPSPPDFHLVGRDPPAPGDVSRSTGLTCGRFGGLLWRPSQKKTGKKGLESPFFIRQAAPDLVVASRQPVAPSPDRACPLAPHAVVMGSCQRRAAPVRNALRRVQGLEAAFWGTIAVLAAAPATRACRRDGNTCYGDV